MRVSITREAEETHFMNWMRKKLTPSEKSDFPPCSDHMKYDFMHISNQRISDALEQEYLQWTCENPVFISAQTGSGKNYFILNEIFPSMKNNEYMLILNNRKSLSLQSKMDVARVAKSYFGHAEYDKHFKNANLELIDDCIYKIKNVYVSTYHKLNSLKIPGEVKYVICDECHFFTSDANFNEFTDDILKEIISRFRSSIRVYMSATMETAFESILYEEYNYSYNLFKNAYEAQKDFVKDYNEAIDLEYLQNTNPKLYNEKMINKYRKNYELGKIPMMEIKYYLGSFNYNYIKEIYVYDSIKSLSQFIISKFVKGEKWLIFLETINNGNKLKEFIKDKREDIVVEAVSSESRDKSDAYKEIITKEKLPENIDILISTAVLDNGVNLNDSSIKNIVIDTLNKEEFLQMLGRKRVKNRAGEVAEEINLYIKNYSDEELKENIKKKVIKLLDILYFDNIDFYSLNAKEKTDYFKKNISFLKFQQERDSDIINITYNKCLIPYLINFINPLISIFQNHDNENQKTPPYEIVKFNECDEYFSVRASLNECLRSNKYYYSWMPYIDSIKDVIEDEISHKERKKKIEYRFNQGNPYQENYLYDDNFSSYILDKSIEFYESRLKDRKEDIIKGLDENYRRNAEGRIESLQKFHNTSSLNIIEELHALSDYLRSIRKPISLEYEEEDYERILHYEELKNCKPKDAMISGS